MLRWHWGGQRHQRTRTARKSARGASRQRACTTQTKLLQDPHQTPPRPKTSCKSLSNVGTPAGRTHPPTPCTCCHDAAGGLIAYHPLCLMSPPPSPGGSTPTPTHTHTKQPLLPRLLMCAAAAARAPRPPLRVCLAKRLSPSRATLPARSPGPPCCPPPSRSRAGSAP